MIGQPGEHVGKPGLRIDAVELGGLDQRVDGGGAAAAFVGAGEGPVLAADGDGTQLAFGGVVGHAQPAVIDEPRADRTALSICAPLRSSKFCELIIAGYALTSTS
jgi:hypothetical protein